MICTGNPGLISTFRKLSLTPQRRGMAGQHSVNVSGAVPPDHEFCEFIPVDANTTVAELREICIERCPALANTGLELVGRSDSNETPCVRADHETVCSIWPE